MLRINLRQPQTNIWTFFLESFIIYVRLNQRLGTFHVILFVCISYQMQEMWSCVTFYHLLNRFLLSYDDCVSTS